ncbi:MAG TPA: DUF2157 domain-containing protein [Spirochaetota bacterium]|nr:DUF2157 domain-containing protein [Spirochaetota bacterium]
MADIKDMLQWLLNEVNIWITKGIITPEQRDRILKLYKVQAQNSIKPAAQKAAVKHTGRINLARVILVLAVVCIAVGLVIFYASNWRRMPPGVKMAQVFLLILTCYGASWFLLFVKKEIFIGRLILMLAMVTFGIGIMLVAQIYHISSHPTNGLLVWAIGTLLLSAVLDEQWGYYMSLALFTIWDYWEVVEYGNAAYLFIAPLLVLALFYYRRSDRTGLVLSVSLMIIYFFQVNIHWAGAADYNNKHVTEAAFMYMLYGFGPLLMVAGRMMRFNEKLEYSGYVVTLTGWITFMVPLLTLSWPYKIPDTTPLILFPRGTWIQSGQFAAFILLSAAGIRKLSSMDVKPHIYIPFILTALILVMVPHYSTTARMISTHIAIVGLIASSLSFAYLVPGEWHIEKGMAFLLTIAMFIVKWLGLTGSAFADNGYMVAYLVGFVIFATVCFLVNRLVKHLAEGKSYPSMIMDIITAVAIWFTLYTASFKIENQVSIFKADTVVIVMLFLFITLAVILYMVLMARLKQNRTIIYLSMIVFITSGIALFIARGEVSWIAYSLIFNILLFIATGTAIYYSTVIQSRALLNVAVCAFIVHIGTRYFDLFWDMLSGSVLFITTGIIGLAGGYILDKKRRQLINTFDSAEGDHE